MGREPATPSMLEIDLESREFHAVRRTRSTPACRSASGTIGELGPTVVTLDQAIRCSQLTRAGVRGYRSGVCGRPLGKRASRAFIPATVVWPERGQLLAPS